MKQYKIFSDGGARGNPGPAAAGFIIYDQNDRTVFSQSRYIGKTTNNVAEYWGVIDALSWAAGNINKDRAVLNCYLDSQLVANQLNGTYKVKDPKMKNLIIKVRQIEQKLREKFSVKTVYHYIPREKNSKADSLVNQALDFL